MRHLLFWLTIALASPAAADLYTVEKDGEIFITTRPVKGGRVLYHVRDDRDDYATRSQRARKGRRRASRRATTRSKRAGGGAVNEKAARYSHIVQRAAAHYGLPIPLIWAVMKVESGFNPRAVSRVGAKGLMQMMPFTWKEMGVRNPFDPEQAIFGGSRYLRILANKFDGDLVKTLSAYHAGGGAVNRANGIPYTQTAEYVRRVLNAYYQYQVEPPAP
ncbi:MAG: lytic transglycosylase domain-containing protein [Alphaproteobacteria bacterium]|nr:lytic transglycosylase domain-containing protein [Myxococcales bacterium]MCB9745572.1 lytic transglycosylase domain-containing protein [Alphaproteobacteria bacterium]